MSIDKRLYVLLRGIAIVILVNAIFVVYVGTMWYFDALASFQKFFGLFYIFIFAVTIFLRPGKNILFYSLVIIGLVPSIYFLIVGIQDYHVLYDIAIPLIVILAYLILIFLSNSSPHTKGDLN